MTEFACGINALTETGPCIMNSLPATHTAIPEVQWSKLYRILGGHIFFQTLSAAVRLDLFGVLHKFGPLNRTEIAAHLGIDEKPARILLLGCATLELVEKEGDSYRNSPMANALLVREAPGNIVSIVEWQHFINYMPMQYFYESLKANRNVGLDAFDGDEATLYGRLAHYPELEAIFQNAMGAISVQANAMLADQVDFSQIKYLVDVGGGNGSNIISLARKFPHLRAAVFDSPSVCEIARENIRNNGLADRLCAIAGNCFEDPFPAEADCFIFCHFFTIWSEERNRQLLAKCFDILPSSGKVMIFNMMQSDDEDGPLTAAMGSPYFLTLATGTGMLYTWEEYESWMKSAGFTSIISQTLLRDHGLICGTK